MPIEKQQTKKRKQQKILKKLNFFIQLKTTKKQKNSPKIYNFISRYSNQNLEKKVQLSEDFSVFFQKKSPIQKQQTKKKQ